MFDRLERSWRLAKQSFDVLRDDKSLLLFPLLSAVAIALVTASFAIPLFPLVPRIPYDGRPPESISVYALAFLFYFITFPVMSFFNTTLVEVAMRSFDGEDATVGDGLRRAWSRLPVILMYSLMAASVGTVLRGIEERVGLVGRIVIGLIGFVWAVATALVVPVLAAEDVGPYEAITRSTELIRKTWGEEIIGSVGIELVSGLAMAAVIGVGGVATIGTFTASASLGFVVAAAVVLAMCLVAIAQMALQGIYAAALYRYADGDKDTGGFGAALLENAFRARA